MGYIKDMYGDREFSFIEGFLAAMNIYSIWRDGKRWIGSPETELKSEMRTAIEELGGDPRNFPEP